MTKEEMLAADIEAYRAVEMKRQRRERLDERDYTLIWTHEAQPRLEQHTVDLHPKLTHLAG